MFLTYAFLFFILVALCAAFVSLEKIRVAEKKKNHILWLLKKNEEKRMMAEVERNAFLKIISFIEEGVVLISGKNKISFANHKAIKIMQNPRLLGAHVSEIENNDVKEIIFSGRDELKREIKINGAWLYASVLNFKSGKAVILEDVSKIEEIKKSNSELIFSIVHQIRTSISAIKWSIKMLLDGDFGKATKEQRDLIKRLYNRNEELIGLLNNLLSASKIDKGIYVYDKSPADLEKIILSVIEFFQDKIKIKKINFSFKKPARKIPSVLMDAEKIKSAVQNLLDNALKYTPEGGNINISLEYNGGNAEFKIEDSGIGVLEEDREKMFNKFFRGANAFGLNENGSGLGLFITKKIIESHGGKIWFESGSQGSKFHFILPIQR